MKSNPAQRFLTAFLLSILILTATFGYGQVITNNDSFEGSVGRQGFPPTHWYNLGYSNSSVDTQPGVFKTEMPASNGKTYISLVCREMSPPGTYETCWTKLVFPFKKGECIDLQIDLAISNEFTATLAWTDYKFNAPCKLQILAANNLLPNNIDSVVVWESEVITNNNWQTYNVHIGPLANDYKYLLLQPYFANINTYTNSAILIDNLRLDNTSKQLSHDSRNIWIPENATNIKWYINNELLPDSSQIQIQLQTSGVYQVVYTDDKGCNQTAQKEVQLNLDMLNYYPNPTNSKVWVQSFSNQSGDFELLIFNDIGQLMSSQKITVVAGFNQFEVDLSSLGVGMYMCKLSRLEGGWTTFKIVKVASR